MHETRKIESLATNTKSMDYGNCRVVPVLQITRWRSPLRSAAGTCIGSSFAE